MVFLLLLLMLLLMEMLHSAWASVKEGIVDFRSQEALQRLLVSLFVAGTCIGFVFGFATESFSNSCYILLAVAAVAFVVCVPSWPLYKQHTIPYTPHDPARIARLYGDEYVAACGSGAGASQAVAASEAATASAANLSLKKHRSFKKKS